MQDPGNALSQELLERLEDIHAAAEPSWWPPSPGWWVVAAIIIALLVYVLVKILAALRIKLRRRRLLTELDQLSTTFDPDTQAAGYLAALNRLFRAIALRAFPDSHCARLQGSAWVTFIRERLPTHVDASGLDILETGPYRPGPAFDAVQLQAAARQWVLKHG